VEEGQGSIVEDEMEDLESDPYKTCIFKRRYVSGGCTRRFWRLMQSAVADILKAVVLVNCAIAPLEAA
jgi:hypothetical protein